MGGGGKGGEEGGEQEWRYIVGGGSRGNRGKGLD